MTCEQALLLLSGHLDGENTPQEEAKLQAHLEICPECRQVLQTMSQIDTVLQEPLQEPPAELCENVMKAIAAEKAPKKIQKRAWRIFPVAAAMLVVVLGARWLPQAESREEAQPMLARSMTAAHTAQDSIEQEDVGVMLYSVEQPEEETPQHLATELGADVAVTEQMLPELENEKWETLENGDRLCHLENSEQAAVLSQSYALALYHPQQADTASGSYVLLRIR